MATLVDRYVHAVPRELPRSMRDDVAGALVEHADAGLAAIWSAALRLGIAVMLLVTIADTIVTALRLSRTVVRGD